MENQIISSNIIPDPPFQPQPVKAKMKLWKKILLSFVIIIVVLGATALSLPRILSIFWGKDTPIPDDSDLRMSVVHIPDDQNAFFDLEKIGELNSYTPSNYKSFFSIDYTNYNKPVKWNQPMVDDVLSKNQIFLDAFDQAAQKQFFQVPEYADPAKISVNMKIYPMNSWREASRLKAIQALSYSWTNQPDKAASTSIEIIRVGYLMQNSQGSTIQFLLATAMKNLGYQTLMQILPYGNFSSDELKTYIAEIDGYKTSSLGLKTAFMGEHIIQMQTLDAMASGKIDQVLAGPDMEDNANQPIAGKIPNRFYFKPNQTKQSFNNYIRHEIALSQGSCSESSTFEDKDEILMPAGGRFKIFFTENFVGKMLHDAVALGFSSLQVKRCQQDLLHQVALSELALRAYKIDNQNRPDSLSALVPNYLQNEPEDVFSGQTLKYDKAKGIIYSVGQNKKDLGGQAGTNWIEADNPTFKIGF